MIFPLPPVIYDTVNYCTVFYCKNCAPLAGIGGLSHILCWPADQRPPLETLRSATSNAEERGIKVVSIS